MNKNPWIPTFGPALMLGSLLAVASIQLHAGAGIKPTKLTKWKRATPANQAKSKMTMPSFRLALPDFTPRVPGSTDVPAEPTRYLPVRGPIDLRLTATSPTIFDRSKVIYIEHQGSFPQAPKPYPPVAPSPTVPQVPAPVPPPPTQASAATTAPVVANTTEPTLLQRLQNPGPRKSNTGTTLLFNNKIDGVSPSGQEILTPFMVPLNTAPPAIQLGTKATYILE